MKTLLAFLLLFAVAPARALDAACTTTTNLGMARCPENSEDWYESYTDQIDALDSLAKTAPSSFTALGSISTPYGLAAATGSFSGSVTASSGTILGSADGAGQAFNVTGSTLVVLNNGKVGIGGSPSNKLNVFGITGAPSTNNTGEGYARFNKPGGYADIQFGGYDGTPNYIGWMQTSNGTTVQDLAINPLGGSVGIGTASPATTLDVNGIVTSSGTVYNNQNIILADTGDANPSTLTFTPKMRYNRVFCQDVHGCTLTFGETDAVNGMIVTIVNVQADANTTLTFDANAAQLTGGVSWTTFGAYDAITLMYVNDRWVELSRSDK